MPGTVAGVGAGIGGLLGSGAAAAGTAAAGIGGVLGSSAGLPLAMLASAGGGVASSLIGANAANNAAALQAAAAGNAQQLQATEFQIGQNNLAPYLSLGGGATTQLANLYGIPGVNGSTGTQPNYSAFTSSPDYSFASAQGNKSVQQFLASTGQVQGAAGLQGIADFNQGLASQQYGNYFNRLMGLANMGQSAASGSASLAANAGQTMGNTIQAQGQALASGQVGSANALMGGINSVSNNLLLTSLLSRNPSAYGQTNTGNLNYYANSGTPSPGQ